VSAIAPHVLAVLKRDKFFERRDDRLCLFDISHDRKRRQHSFKISRSVLSDIGFDAEEIRDVIEYCTQTAPAAIARLCITSRRKAASSLDTGKLAHSI